MTALLLGAIGISFAAIFAKKAMQHDVGPMTSAFWRLVLAIPIFACIALPHLRRRPKLSWMLLLPGIFFGLDLLTWHLAFTHTTAGAATLLANVSVIFVGAGGWWLLKERLDWRWAAGVALALTGVCLLAVTARSGLGAPNPLLGNTLAIGTALCYAGYLLSSKVARGTTPASVIMLGVVVVAPLVLCVGMAVAREPVVPTNSQAWLWLVLLAIVPQSIGQGLILWGLRSLPASFIAIVLLLQPVATTLWGELLLGEPVRGVDIAFGGLVLLGILLARLGTREASPTTLPG